MRCRSPVQSEDGSSASILLLCLARSFKGQDVPRCYYSFLILLSSHLVQNNKLKHVWSYKGFVNIDGKILKNLPTPSLNRTFSNILHAFAQRQDATIERHC